MFQKLVPFCTKYRSQTIWAFQFAYAVWLIAMIVATWANLSGSTLAYTIYPIGTLLGKLAAILFLVVTVPGILGRFGIRHPFITVGIMFRRHTGISMFLAGLAHGLIVSTLPNIAMGAPLLPRFGFELFGILSMAALTPLFLTSNLYSMKHMGKYWKQIHKIIYPAFWLIVLHTGLRGDLLWTMLLALTGVAEIASLVFEWQKKKKTV